MFAPADRAAGSSVDAPESPAAPLPQLGNLLGAETVPAFFDCGFNVSISCCCATICFWVCKRASRRALTSAAKAVSFAEESGFALLVCAFTTPDRRKHANRMWIGFISRQPLHSSVRGRFPAKTY